MQGYSSDITDIPANATIVSLAFCLASTVSGLRTFGHEYTIFLHRESHGGLITVSYMMGRMMWDIILMATFPAIFLGFYYAFTLIKTPFGLYYIMLVMVGWCVVEAVQGSFKGFVFSG